MGFSSLFRLQQELDKLILRHTDSIADPIARAAKQSSMYEILLQGLIVSCSNSSRDTCTLTCLL